MSALRIGLIVNPVAGIGAEAALFGSDDPEVRAEAGRRGYAPRAATSVRRALTTLGAARNHITWQTAAGEMGSDHLAAAGCIGDVVYEPAQPTSAADTVAAAGALVC